MPNGLKSKITIFAATCDIIYTYLSSWTYNPAILTLIKITYASVMQTYVKVLPCMESYEGDDFQTEERKQWKTCI